jgi:glycosyltransferase involved in cell wall biosynthesis
MNNEAGPDRKVTLFLGDLAMGGAERVFVTLSRLLIKRGYRVELILAHKQGPLLQELDPAVRVIDLGAQRGGKTGWIFGFRSLFKLAGHLRSHPPQVLLSTLTGANLVCLLARALSGCRFRLVIREAVTLDNVTSPIRKLLMRFLYPLADRVIVLTEHMKQEMVDNLKIPSHHLTIIGNPLDTERIDNLAQDTSEQNEISTLTPYVLAIGRLSEQKDFLTLIKAWSRLASTALNLVIIGKGDQKAELAESIRELNLVDNVHLIGFRANPYPWFRAAHGFVLSSRWEGYPNAMLEAIYFGLPVVATEYDPSVYSLLSSTPDDYFRIVPVGQAERLSDAIHELLADTKEARSTPERNRNFTADVLDQYESALAVNTILDGDR